MASARFRFSTGPSATGPWTADTVDAPLTTTVGTYVRVSLESNAGVNALACAITSADEVTLASALPTVTVDQATKTAVFRVALLAPDGLTYLVRATVNSGIDADDATTAAYEKSLAVHVLSRSGQALLAVGETDESDRAYGHTAKLNAALRAATPPLQHRVYLAQVTTLNATPVDALVLTNPSANCTVHVMYTIVAHDSAHNAAGYVVSTTAKYVYGSAWTVLLTKEFVKHEDVGSWAYAVSAPGGNLLLTVTGDATNQTEWTCHAAMTIIAYT